MTTVATPAAPAVEPHLTATVPTTVRTDSGTHRVVAAAYLPATNTELAAHVVLYHLADITDPAYDGGLPEDDGCAVGMLIQLPADHDGNDMRAGAYELTFADAVDEFTTRVRSAWQV